MLIKIRLFDNYKPCSDSPAIFYGKLTYNLYVEPELMLLKKHKQKLSNGNNLNFTYHVLLCLLETFRVA